MVLTLNIIGAGNLGKTLGHLLVKHTNLQIGYVCNRSQASAKAAIDFIGQGSYCAQIENLPAADITLIGTGDDEISSVSQRLSLNPFLKKESTVFHCSGALNSDLLQALRPKCYIASLHPMKSFSEPKRSLEQFPGTFCALEGDREALALLQNLLQTLGAVPYLVDKTKKASYHCAGVFASNYLITLAENALLCMKDAGVDRETALPVVLALMQNTLSNLQDTLSLEKALTGPIQRGDINTLAHHLQAFTNTQQKILYTTLGKATLPLSKLTNPKRKEVESLFELA